MKTKLKWLDFLMLLVGLVMILGVLLQLSGCSKPPTKSYYSTRTYLHEEGTDSVFEEYAILTIYKKNAIHDFGFIEYHLLFDNEEDSVYCPETNYYSHLEVNDTAVVLTRPNWYAAFKIYKPPKPQF